MKNFVQFLTTPTADTPGTTLLLHFDNRRYLLGNVSEGTQRAATQIGARLVKTSCMFLTGRTEWANVGGVLGMVLTLADSSANQISAMLQSARNKAKREQVLKEVEDMKKGMRIVGPRNLTHMIATSRRFIFRQGMPILPVEVRGVEEVTDKPFWEDENIQVWALATAPGADMSDMKGTRAGNVSPGRKRSFDEMRGRADGVSAVNGSSTSAANGAGVSPEKTQEHDQIRQGVVGAMFDSDWKFDHLLEMPLSQVQLPASIFVTDPETNRLKEYKGPMPSADPSVGSTIVKVRRPWPGALVRSLPPTQPAKESVSYIVRNHFQRGRFLPEKAKELGVPKSQFKDLTSGKPVTTPEGKTVKADDVITPGRQGYGFAVVDIPSVEYVAPTLARPEWTNPAIMDGVKAFIWILGPGVLEDDQLQGFIEKTREAEHIVSSVDCCPNQLAMDSVAVATHRLSQVDPERYIVPGYSNDALSKALLHSRVIPNDASAAKRGMVINLEPSFNVVQPDAPPLLIGDRNDAADAHTVSQEVKTLAQEAHQKLDSEKTALNAWAQRLPCPEAEVLTLGTGSALPSKYRNVSATLVRVPGIGSYLLDCGENTLGQLARVYSPNELTEILKDLRMIWISHLHADHHLGTASIIKAWYRVNHPSDSSSTIHHPSLTGTPFRASELTSRPRLAVISDTGMLDWPAEYAHCENFGHHMTMPFYISNASLTSRSELSWAPMLETVGPLAAIDKKHYEPLIGFSDIQAVGVQHCHGAKAVSITFPNGFKVSYSGDCRPNKNFAKIGRESTVLIHEATFDDELSAEARAKQHSTTSEALAVAAEMKARSVVLTHFSQRYQKIPVMEDVGGLSEDEDEGYTIESQPYKGRMKSRRSSRDHDDRPINEDEDEVMQEAMLDMAGEAAELGGGKRRAPPASRNILNGTKRGVDESEPADMGDAAETSEQAVPTDKGTVGETRVKVNSRDMKVCVAFDYMRVRVGDIAKMEYFTPALMKLFEEPEKPLKPERSAVDGKNVEERRAEEGKKREKGLKKKASWEGEGRKAERREINRERFEARKGKGEKTKSYETERPTNGQAEVEQGDAGDAA